MLSKEIKKYIAYPPKRKVKRGHSFFELAKRHIIKSNDPRDRNLSERIDEIVYGVRRPR